MRVVNLDACRDLLKTWTQVRELLLSGAEGFVVSVKKDGKESVFSAGQFEHDRNAASEAALRASWELAKGSRRTKKQ